MMEILPQLVRIGQEAKRAAKYLSTVKPEIKNMALEEAANQIQAKKKEIIKANQIDLEEGRKKSLSEAMMDRLELNSSRLDDLIESVHEVVSLEDPVNKILAEWTRPSGIKIRRISSPLGVIGIIFESRPNVTIDAACLCFKSGNASILRGGSDSFNTSHKLHECFVEGLNLSHLPPASSQIIPTKDRRAVDVMLRLNQYIDIIVPRGGRSLVELVQKQAKVPVFSHLEGICHVYVDKEADLEKAIRIVVNSKTRRTGICSSAECLLIHQEAIHNLGIPIIEALVDKGVEVRGSVEFEKFDGVIPAKADDYGREFLSSIISLKAVGGVEDAIEHISNFGSGHTDAIVTENNLTAAKFMNELDSAVLMQNASTQFSDGNEFGMGAEIGIATGKIHARGPVGVNQLTSFKYLVEGNGTIRA